MKPSRLRTVNAGKGKRTSKSGNLAKLMFYAPIALEVLNLVRQNSKKKQGKYVKARKRDRAFDFLLEQAQQRLGGKKPAKRRWF